MPDIYKRPPQLDDFDSRLVQEFGIAHGLDESAEAFINCTEALGRAMEDARPALRNRLIESLLDNPSQQIWNPDSGIDITDIFLPEGLQAQRPKISTSLMTYELARRDYQQDKAKITATPEDLGTLQDGLAKMRDVVGTAIFESNDAESQYSNAKIHLLGLLAVHDHVSGIADHTEEYAVQLGRFATYRLLDRLYSTNRELLSAPVHADAPLESQAKEVTEAFNIPNAYSRVHTALLVEGDPQIDELTKEDAVYDLSTTPGENLFDTYVKRIVATHVASVEEMYKVLNDFDPKNLFGRQPTPSYEAMLERLKISGNIPEHYHPDEQYQFIHKLLPLITFAGIKHIDFSYPRLIEQRMRVDGKITEGYAGGHYRHKHSRVWVNTDDLGDTKDMQNVIAHEVAHGLVYVVHPRFLADFIKVTKKEPVMVSEYIEDLSRVNAKSLVREDFAESVALQLTNPRELRRIAPRRAKMIRKLLAFYTRQLPHVKPIDSNDTSGIYDTLKKQMTNRLF